MYLLSFKLICIFITFFPVYFYSINWRERGRPKWPKWRKMPPIHRRHLRSPAINKEVILEQVLGTRRGHKTGVGHTLSQRVHASTSSSSSRLEGSSVCMDLNVEEYLCRSYEQNLQMYESYRMMQQLLA